MLWLKRSTLALSGVAVLSFALCVVFLLKAPAGRLRAAPKHRRAADGADDAVDGAVDGDPWSGVDCGAIVDGDGDAVLRAALLSKAVAFKRRLRPLTEDDLLNRTRDCEAFRRGRRYAAAAPSREEETFPIAYAVVAHHRVDMLERLLRAVYAPQNLYCLHVDAKAPRRYLEAVRALAACFPNVFVAARLESVVYASWSRVQADLNCMRELVDRDQVRSQASGQAPEGGDQRRRAEKGLGRAIPWKYFINLCGLDFPIKTNLEIVRALRGLRGRNNMETIATPAHKRKRWEYRYDVAGNGIRRTDVKKPPPPIASPMFAGSAYVVVTRAFVEHVLEDATARAFAEWEKDTYSPDEHMWATLQRMPGVPGSTPWHVNYDTTDTVAIVRAVKWSSFEGEVARGASYPRCRGSYVRAVCVYGVGDLAWLLSQHHLFANKVDTEVDSVAVLCLERYLRRRAEEQAGE